jgi:hypothetical protein
MQTSVVHGWRCRYDLQTGKFDAPALFSDNNAKAVVPKSPGAFRSSPTFSLERTPARFK